MVIYGDKTFKPLVSRGSHYDYAAFVQGSVQTGEEAIRAFFAGK